MLTTSIIERPSWPERVAEQWQDTTDRILARVVMFEPTETKAIYDALYVLWMKTGVKVDVLNDGVVVATTPEPPEKQDGTKGYRDPTTGIQYPVDTYVDDRTMKALLKAHGVNVTMRELREKAGIKWDGGPGDNKWYEALEHYGVSFPEKQAFAAMDAADSASGGYRTLTSGLIVRGA